VPLTNVLNVDHQESLNQNVNVQLVSSITETLVLPVPITVPPVKTETNVPPVKTEDPEKTVVAQMVNMMLVSLNVKTVTHNVLNVPEITNVSDVRTPKDLVTLVIVQLVGRPMLTTNPDSNVLKKLTQKELMP
jgi:hypothetical protein